MPNQTQLIANEVHHNSGCIGPLKNNGLRCSEVLDPPMISLMESFQGFRVMPKCNIYHYHVALLPRISLILSRYLSLSSITPGRSFRLYSVSAHTHTHTHTHLYIYIYIYICTRTKIWLPLKKEEKDIVYNF